MTQTVVITGASGGIGRATARLFGERGASVGLIARGRAGLDGAAREVEAAGGTALPIEADVADHAQVEAAAGQVEEKLGPIDVWVNVRVHLRVRPVRRDHRRTSSAGSPRSATWDSCTGRWRRWPGCGPATRARSSRSAPRWASAASRCSPPTAARSTPSTGSPPRCAANCCTRDSRVARHGGADARRQHPAVLLGALPAAAAPAAGAADLPARGRRPRRAVRRRPPAPQAVLGRAPAPRPPSLANRIAPALLDRYLARTGYGSQQTGRAAGPAGPDNLWQPLDGPGGPTTARTGPSTTVPIPAAHSSG